MTTTVTSPDHSALPKVLTRGRIPSLIKHLDASDVLECYSLTRKATLDGFHNATVQKMAIGIRYDPPAKSHKAALELTLEYGPQRVGEKFERESTPNFLPDQNHVSWDNQGNVYYTTSSIQSLQWKSAFYMGYLTGAVLEKLLDRAVGYSSDRPLYQPFTVVLSQSNSDFSDGERKMSDRSSTDENESSSVSQPKVLLKSSSSVDFVYQMWSELVALGVDLRPILMPPIYRVELFSSSKNIEKVSGYDNDGLLITEEAAIFFQKFKSCFTAIATGDYSQYESPQPSIAPSEFVDETFNPTTMPTKSISENPTEGKADGGKDEDLASTENNIGEEGNSTFSKAHSKSKKHKKKKHKESSSSNGEDDEHPSDNKLKETDDQGVEKDVDNNKENEKDDASNEANNEESTIADNNSEQGIKEEVDWDSIPKAEGVYEEKGSNGDDDGNNNNNDDDSKSLLRHMEGITQSLVMDDDIEIANQEEIINNTDDLFANFSSMPSSLSLVTNMTIQPSSRPSSSPIEDDTTTKAQKAAQEAKEAAQQAKNHSSHEAAEKAAFAAEHAANAAKKAADVAKWTKDSEKLLSGDGALVAEALSQCWTDPRFELIEENSTEVIAYIYSNGNFFYRLHLSPPYFAIRPDPISIPEFQPHAGATYDDFVDWTLAFCIMGLMLMGVLMLIQQAGLRLGFYKKQKYFFDPTGENDEEEWNQSLFGSFAKTASPRTGKGHEHFFSQDVIPISMGGQRTGVTRKSELFVTSSPKIIAGKQTYKKGGDVELIEMPAFKPYRDNVDDNNDFTSSNGIFIGDDDDEEKKINNASIDLPTPTAQLPPKRFTRNPDWVDMPNLVSRTKVAKPVTMKSLKAKD